MPSAVSCLFFHAGDDEQVPLSQSVDAFTKINDAGGNASIIVSSQGGHSFFKAGSGHNDLVTASCFSAMDTFFKQTEPAIKALIDNAFLGDGDIGTVEARILEMDRNYENYTKELTEFHNDTESVRENGGRNKLPSKKRLLQKIEAAHADSAKKLERIEHPEIKKNLDFHSTQAQAIRNFLKKS
jgi:hypothetical protein